MSDASRVIDQASEIVVSSYGNFPAATQTQAALEALSDAINVSHLGLDFKESVRAATTAAGTLATDFENGDSLDGVTLATGDRILVKDQATGAENGLYTVNASGAPTRATDLPSAASAANAFVFVEEGTANADTAWVCSNNVGSDVVGTDSLTWGAFGVGGGPTINNDANDRVVTAQGDGDLNAEASFLVNATSLTYTGTRAKLPNGSVIASGDPGIAFESYNDTGLAANAANIAIWESGTIALNLTNSLKEFRVPSDYSYAWSALTNNNAAADIGCSREAAGILRVDGRLSVQYDGAATSSVTTLDTVRQRTSGTPAAGFGSSLKYELESSTTTDRDAADIEVAWVTATDATRASSLKLATYSTTTQQVGLTIEADAAGVKTSVNDETPIARQAHIADPSGGATVDAEARTAINALLAAIENFGILAKS